MIFNIPVGGKRSAVVEVYGAASETVTLLHAKGKEFSAETDTTGYGGTLELPLGEYTVTGSYTGFSKTVTLTKNTSRVDAMPDGTVVYWYGYRPYNPTAKAYAPDVSNITSNRKAPTVTKNTRSIKVVQPTTSGQYIGSAIFNNVTTDGGTLTFLSTGKSVSNSNPKVYFSYAASISSATFTPKASKWIDADDENVTLGNAAAGTYDIAVSVQNYQNTYVGQVTVYAVYFAT